jgi:hypothetical protein
MALCATVAAQKQAIAGKVIGISCTRMKVVNLYPQKSSANSIDFLEYVLEELPFPIQKNGSESKTTLRI